MVSKIKVTNQEFSDLEILDWMDKNGHCVFCVGRVCTGRLDTENPTIGLNHCEKQ